MATYTLSVSMRDTKQTRAQLAKEGLIPAVVYGPGMEPLTISVLETDFGKVFHRAGTSQVITLEIGKDTNPTLVHEVQHNPVSGRVAHVDFYHITKGHKVSAPIPLVFVGVSLGVKDLGGTLVTHMREIEVEGLPEKLPASIEIDLAVLKEFGDEIKVSDIALASDVNPLVQADMVVVSLLAPVAQEPEAVATPEEGEAIPTPAPEEKSAE